MAFDLGGLQNLLPGGQAFTRVTNDIQDIVATLGGALGGGAPAQQPAVAKPADQFQAPAAAQQPAAANGTPQQFSQVINQIMQALQQIVGLLGGGQGQAQAPAVGTGAGGAAPAQTGGAAPAAPAAPQAPAAPANAAGAPQVQGGQGTIQPQPPVGGKNLVLDGTGKILEGVGELFQALAQGRGAGQPGGPPSQGDAGGLSCDANAKAVTTSGGYKIQCDGAHNWSISGPDGKPVKIDGDPHVHQANGSFDFKKDSTFVLPDGTRINCKTKDLGNGTSMSDQLEIENNGQRAVMDVSDGSGKVTAQDRGPEQFHTDQTFTMGADGNFGINGKTITGTDAPDQFKTGADQQLTQQATANAGAAAGAGAANGAGAAAGAGGAQQQGGLAGLLQQIQQMLAGLTGQQPAAAQQPAAQQPAAQQPAAQQPAATQPAQQAQPKDQLSQLLNAIMGMLQALLPLLGGMAKGGNVAA